MVLESRRPLCWAFEVLLLLLLLLLVEVDIALLVDPDPVRIDCATLVGPFWTGPSLPVIVRSPNVMSLTIWEFSSWPTCF
jgi:hypothetical protein